MFICGFPLCIPLVHSGLPWSTTPCLQWSLLLFTGLLDSSMLTLFSYICSFKRILSVFPLFLSAISHNSKLVKLSATDDLNCWSLDENAFKAVQQVTLCTVHVQSAPSYFNFILLTLCRIVTKSKDPLWLQLIALSLGQSNWAHAIQGSGPIKFVGLFLPNLCKTSSCPVVNAENQDYNSMRSSFQLHFPRFRLFAFPQ